MTRYTLALAAAAVLMVPAAASAQPSWQANAPTINANAKVNAVRQFNHTGVSHLDFGTNGVTPGTAATVATTAADAATGTSAKLEVRFNAATRVQASGSALTTTINSVVYSIAPTYTCDRAATAAGAGTAFTCGSGATDGADFGAAAITGMMQMFVRVGATIPTTETDTKPAGTYTGTITITLAASGS